PTLFRSGLILVSIITGVVVITVGAIPFLGLIVPNIVSLYLGDNLSKTLAPTALLGALLVLICDVIGRILIYPYEIPISLIMGVFGSVIFLWLWLRRCRHVYFGQSSAAELCGSGQSAAVSLLGSGCGMALFTRSAF